MNGKDSTHRRKSPPNVQEQLQEWMAKQSRSPRPECRMPPIMFRALIDELRDAKMAFWWVGTAANPQQGIMCNGMAVYPDYTITEFTAK